MLARGLAEAMAKDYRSAVFRVVALPGLLLLDCYDFLYFRQLTSKPNSCLLNPPFSLNLIR